MFWGVLQSMDSAACFELSGTNFWADYQENIRYQELLRLVVGIACGDLSSISYFGCLGRAAAGFEKGFHTSSWIPSEEEMFVEEGGLTSLQRKWIEMS